jgi:hypothetical protein
MDFCAPSWLSLTFEDRNAGTVFEFDNSAAQKVQVEPDPSASREGFCSDFHSENHCHSGAKGDGRRF